MAGENNIKAMSATQLAEAYAQIVQAVEATEHIGKKNRLEDQAGEIRRELRTRGVAREVLRRLADHPDEKVRASAQSNIRWLDTPWQSAGDKHAEVDPDRGHGVPPTPLRWQSRWQCDHPPPPALAHDEIAERLRHAVPEFHNELVRLARPAIGLWPRRPRADDLATTSRFGGRPLAPPDWQWPTAEGEPLLFVGHINCTELRGLPGAEQLPSSGLLAFFGDHDAVEACRLEALDDIAVYHWQEVDRLVPAVASIEPCKVYLSCPLAFRPFVDLPDPHSRAIGNLNLRDIQRSLYSEEWRAARCHGLPVGIEGYAGFSKLLGWPALVQRHDLYRFEDNDDARLLLQVDHYCNGQDSHDWGPGGSLYFIWPEGAARKLDFAACNFDIQFT
jgi:hypothetical protein